MTHRMIEMKRFIIYDIIISFSKILCNFYKDASAFQVHISLIGAAIYLTKISSLTVDPKSGIYNENLKN